MVHAFFAGEVSPYPILAFQGSPLWIVEQHLHACTRIYYLLLRAALGWALQLFCSPAICCRRVEQSKVS
jgi:hypothetical protein